MQGLTKRSFEKKKTIRKLNLVPNDEFLIFN